MCRRPCTMDNALCTSPLPKCKPIILGLTSPIVTATYSNHVVQPVRVHFNFFPFPKEEECGACLSRPLFAEPLLVTLRSSGKNLGGRDVETVTRQPADRASASLEHLFSSSAPRFPFRCARQQHMHLVDSMEQKVKGAIGRGSPPLDSVASWGDLESLAAAS